MKFMVILKGSDASESGLMPSERLLADMGRFNEELAAAGVLRAAEGLHPSSAGARIRFNGRERTVVDGPFPESNELVAGFWIIEVASLDDAVAWMKRSPNHYDDGESEVEIRRIYALEDFGAELTPELREQEARLRARVEER